MENQIKQIMNELVSANATPGVNYAVIKDSTRFTGSLGLKSKYNMDNDVLKETEEINDINTIYDIASLTKVVCTVPIIFRLYEKGKINLSDKVKNYFPNYKYDDTTIYDLLTHTSGLPADLNSKEIISKDECIKKLFNLEKLNDKGVFLYSDIGYMLLGLIIEKICGKSLDKVFEEEVTIPLEMRNTAFNPKYKTLIASTEITKERGCVRGIVHDEKACSMNGVAGHAGVFSNIEDLINFTSMLLSNGMFKGNQYLSKQTLNCFFTPMVNDREYKRSFSWFVGKNPNVIECEDADIISFNGFTGPSMSIDRKNNTAIIMMTNRVHPTRDNRLNSQMRSEISNKIYKCINMKLNVGGSFMNNNYENTKVVFDKYIEECKKRIKDTFFKDDYLVGLNSLRNNLIKEGKLDSNSSISDAIKYERLEMIEIKINHTMRVVEDVVKMAEKMGTNVDFNNILKISALLHDIGRFDQATWNNSFADSCYKDIDGINNHAQAGYHILFVNGRIKDYPINHRFYNAIGSVVYNHGNPILTGDLTMKINSVKDLDISKLTGELNEGEKLIIATLVQMVRDVDMLDILYQHLTGEFPVIRKDITFDTLGESINDIATYWNVSANDLLDYNGITEKELENMKTIKIPVDKIDLHKLSVPEDIKESFFKNENIDLKEIMNRRDWTFITGMWWRLNHFLNNINFTSNLQLIHEKRLLEKIYNEYPDEYKFLVHDAFEFANSKLIEQPLRQNDSSIYVDSIKKI